MTDKINEKPRKRKEKTDSKESKARLGKKKREWINQSTVNESK